MKAFYYALMAVLAFEAIKEKGFEILIFREEIFLC